MNGLSISRTHGCQSKENIQHECPDKWHRNSWDLCLDDAPGHVSPIVWQFLAYTNTTVIPHPPFSLDLTPCDFFLFLKMKLKLGGQCFGSIKKIQTILQNVVKTLTLKGFQKCFRSWKSHWNCCFIAKGIAL
jgi:histone-lysine N-methyltransferase SETMAR